MQVRVDLPEVIGKQVKSYEALLDMPHQEFISFALTDFILRKGPLGMTPKEFTRQVIEQSPLREAELEEVLEGRSSI